MRVCVVTPLHASKSRGYGVERYAYEIQAGLKNCGVAVKAIDSARLLERYESSRTVRALGVAYEGVQLIRCSRRCSVIHFAEPVLTVNSLLLRGAPPKVTTVHEVPDELSKGMEAVVGMAVMKVALVSSDMIIADSSATKADLVEKLRANPDRVAVVNLGIGNEFVPSTTEKVRETRTIGYLGGISRKKNVETLLEAFKVLKTRYPSLKVRLDIWGVRSKYAAELMGRLHGPLLRDVHFRGFAAEQTLPSVYHTFDVFVFPSLKEGFGFPILEAKRCGIPTVVLRKSKIGEEVKANSVLVEDASDMADKIHDLLADSAYSRRVAGQALEYSRKFTWERTVRETKRIYEQASSR